MKVSKRLAVRFVLGLGLSTTLAACLSSGGGGGGSGGSAPTTTANISGSVSGLTSSNSSSSFSYVFQKMMAKMGVDVGALTNDDGCDNGTFTAAYVGDGGAQVASGTFSAGEFEIPDIIEGKELIATFTCDDGSSQRCLVKSGDEGVSCNPVADSVIGAFESALGMSIYNSSFSGKSLAKVGSAIVQAASTESTAAAAFNEAILSCKTLTGTAKATCYEEAIQASPFLGAFKMMKTLHEGWSVDALFTLMVDVFGAQVDVDPFIFSTFATHMDTWLNTDFVAQTRNYLADVADNQGNADQDSTGSEYVTKLECQMHYNKFQSGGKFKFSPVKTTINGVLQLTCKNNAAFAANGFSIAQRDAMYAAMDAGGNNNQIDLSSAPQKGCTEPWRTPGAFCAWTPSIAITSRFEEPNRNDPTGEHDDFYEKPRIGMIDVFPEAYIAIMAANSPSADTLNCLTIPSDGPPDLVNSDACVAWFGTIMSSQAKNFSGLIGLYKFLRSTSATSKLSLDDIHKLFSQSDFMNMRAALRGHNTCGAQIIGDSNGGWLPSLASYSATTGLFTAQTGFGCNFNGNNQISQSAAQSAIAAAEVPYGASFQMFEQIPAANEINSFVFGAGIHSDWNPTGSKQFWAAGIHGTTRPIFCKMSHKVSGKPKEAELDGSTSISCLTNSALSGVTSAGNNPDANGVMTLPKGYPYILLNYGYQGDGKGAIFALGDAKNGQELRIAGNPVLVQQKHSGNSASCNDASDINKVYTEKVTLGFGDSTQSQAVKLYCMEMADFEGTSSFFLYHGGMVSIKQVNDDGSSWDWYAPQVGVRDPQSTTGTMLPLCYFASASTPGFDTDTQSGLTTASNGATISPSTGEMAPIGTNDSIDLCDNADNHNGKTKYYLMMMGSWMNSTRDSLKIGIIGSSSGARPLQHKHWGDSGVNNWDDMMVFLKPSVVEAKFNNIATSCTAGDPATCKAVAPTSSQTPIMSVKLANQRWNPKFDPFCDDRNGNGKCDCFAKGTTTSKDPNQCTLEDDAAEPTMSYAPYWSGAPNAAALDHLFETMGGKAGADLGTYTPEGGSPVTFNGQFLHDNQLWFDHSSAFLCQHLAQGETSYRSPTMLKWDNFAALDHEGCPSTPGGAIPSAPAGGPVRMVKPIAAANMYAVSRPNSLIKMINYATKSTGQGIQISKTEKVFSFDEAIALVSLRQILPAHDIPVYASGTTSPSSSARVKGTVVSFERVHIGGDGPGSLDAVGSVLRAITHPEDLAD